MLFKSKNDLITKILCFFILTKKKLFFDNLNNIHDKMNLTGNIVHVWSLL